jgi:hypothetical protein
MPRRLAQLDDAGRSVADDSAMIFQCRRPKAILEAAQVCRDERREEPENEGQFP